MWWFGRLGFEAVSLLVTKRVTRRTGPWFPVEEDRLVDNDAIWVLYSDVGLGGMNGIYFNQETSKRNHIPQVSQFVG